MSLAFIRRIPVAVLNANLFRCHFSEERMREIAVVKNAIAFYFGLTLL